MIPNVPPPAWIPWTEALAGLSLNPDFFPRAERYLDALASINTELNLTAFDPLREGKAHIVDSLQVLRALPEQVSTIIDVGTGGGFPGFPVALARPLVGVTLVDALRKKQTAVARMAATVGANNVSSVWGRAEDLGHEAGHREKYDVALCRAVGRFSMVLELTLPLVRIGGLCLLHRGQEAPMDLTAAVSHWGTLGARHKGSLQYRLPGNDHDRFVICIEKTDQISDRYPRRAGIPAKRPLW